MLTYRLEPQFLLIKEFAERKNVEFRYDGFIVPKINGESLDNQTISPEKVLKYDCMKPGFIEGMKKKLESKEYASLDSLYVCDAGINSIFIDAESIMSICSFARNISIKLNHNMTIMEGREILLEILKKKRDLKPSDLCYRCNRKDLCRYCPGQFLLQNGNEFKPNAWNCEYADKLLSIIKETN